MGTSRKSPEAHIIQPVIITISAFFYSGRIIWYPQNLWWKLFDGGKFWWWNQLSGAVRWLCRLCMVNLKLNLKITLDVTKYGANHRNTSEIQSIFPKRPYIRAYPYEYGRLLYTGIHIMRQMKRFSFQSLYRNTCLK